MTVAASLGTRSLKAPATVFVTTVEAEVTTVTVELRPADLGCVAYDHVPYYPGAHRIHQRLTGDRTTGLLLGLQMVGHRQGEVAKRIDTAATALHHGDTVDGLLDLDLSYAPPFGSPWDAVQSAAQAWEHARSWAGGSTFIG